MSVNRVILVGSIGQIQELKTLQNGKSLISFSLATSERYKDKSGEQKTDTEWHNITFFDKSAETISKYCSKGTKLYVEGKIKSEKYTDKAGVEKTAIKIIGSSFSIESKIEGEAKSDAKGSAKEEPIVDNDDSSLPF